MSQKAIFLSASVPLINRGTYHETANAFLIQCAVRELVIAVIRNYRIVWGGHPAITPMVWSICEDLGVDYSQNVILYQSMFFEEQFPEENERFKNVIFTEAIENDREKSLRSLREKMLSRDDLVAAVFIGGMEGVEDEYSIFKHFHTSALALPVASPGGASLELALKLGTSKPDDLVNVDFSSLFHKFIKSLP